MPALPSSLALTTISDGTQIVAVDHRNNYGNVQTAVNALIAALGGGVAGQYLSALSPSAIGWAAPPTPPTYRKTTAKTINNTVTETDLLNGEITIPGAVMGTTGLARLTARGDYLQSTGSTIAMPRFKLKLGGTTIIDTGAMASSWNNAAPRGIWVIDATIQNLGVANSQWAQLAFRGVNPVGWNAASGTALTTGQGAAWPATGASHGFIDGAATSAIDTTGAKLLELTVTLPVANALCEFKLYNALVEVI